MESLNLIGKAVFDALIGASYWIIAAIAVKNLLKDIAKQDIDGVVKTLINTAVCYGALFMVTKILDMVKDVMK